MFLLRWFETMIRNLTVHIFLPIIGCEVLQRFGQRLVRLEWKKKLYFLKETHLHRVFMKVSHFKGSLALTERVNFRRFRKEKK